MPGSPRAVPPRLPEPREYRLRDGTSVVARPILPADKERLREGFHRLSPEARYQRFLATVSDLSAAQLRHLTEIDYHDHMAWVALDPARPDFPMVGVARYIRVENQPDVAEVAVTVADAWRGKGVGTLLLELLCEWAAAHGVKMFRAFTFETNDAMIRIFRDIGAHVVRHDEGVLALDMPVPATPADLPDNPTGRAFREVARARAGGAPR
jgi:RimJ/RimL family protein N-acetyltransferase